MICHRSKYLRILYIIWQGQEKKKVYRSKLTGQVGKNSHSKFNLISEKFLFFPKKAGLSD